MRITGVNCEGSMSYEEPTKKFKVGDWVQTINNPDIIFQIEEFHHGGIVIHNGLLIEERFLRPYKGSFCPICGKPEVEEDKQPQPGTHIITLVYECGTEVDYPLGSDDYVVSKRCDEHNHIVDNATGKCTTCGENVDKEERTFKIGDWVKYKASYAQNRPPFKVYGYTGTAIISKTGNVIQRDALELWKPSEGEWCCRKFTTKCFIVGPYGMSGLMKEHLEKGHLEPFVGEISSFVKDIE